MELLWCIVISGRYFVYWMLELLVIQFDEDWRASYLGFTSGRGARDLVGDAFEAVTVTTYFTLMSLASYCFPKDSRCGVGSTAGRCIGSRLNRNRGFHCKCLRHGYNHGMSNGFYGCTRIRCRMVDTSNRASRGVLFLLVSRRYSSMLSVSRRESGR